MLTTLVLIVLSTALLADKVSAGDGYPVSSAARRWVPDRTWLRGAFCVHRGESIRWHIVNPPYSGGMQFMDSTWQRVGGRGRAADWAPREQLYRAWLIWRQDGGSWHEWPTTSRACGLS